MENTIIKKHEHNIFIDLSYFVFYRYYALVSHIKISSKKPKHETEVDEEVVVEPVFNIDNPSFIEKYDRFFERSMLDVIKKYTTFTKTKSYQDINVYFAKDCARCDIWRTTSFQEYKANRDNVKHHDIFDGRIFEHTYKRLIPRLITKYPFIHVCSAPNAEADDVIAVLVQKCCILNERNNVIVITNDYDYLQLLDNVSGMYNLQGKDLQSKTIDGCGKKHMLFKIIHGDPSDNIKGIWPKSKTMKFIQQYESAKEVEESFICQASSEQQKLYFHNKMLICFTQIPERITSSIVSDFQSHTKDNCTTCSVMCSNDE
jgi:5'-3' exonuclease